MQKLNPISWMARTTAGVGLAEMVIYTLVLMLIFNISMGIIAAIPIIIIGVILGAVTGAFMQLAMLDDASSTWRIWGFGFGGAVCMFLAAFVPLIMLAFPTWSKITNIAMFLNVVILFPMIIAFVTVSGLSGVFAWRVVHQKGRKSKRKNDEVKHPHLTDDSTHVAILVQELPDDTRDNTAMRSG